MIISIGYRVNSIRGTQFRWANNLLKDYLVKGYALNESRLKEQIRQLENRKVKCLNMNPLIEKVMLSKLDGFYIKLLNHLERQTLIIKDDFGLQNLGQDVRFTLLQLLEDRYRKKSIIVTSQLLISKWNVYIINDPTLADAILDRLTANAQRIEQKGESLRRKKQK